MKLYMVIESFLHGPAPVYRRFHDKGRMLPDGLEYVDSWLTEDGGRCFQIMRADDPKLFEAWIASWSDLVSYEIIPLGKKPEARSG